jgi:DNA polymerase I-like protein with 3'-5' exonuclease and polymerase domains
MLEEKLHTLTGVAMRPHTNEDCFEVLCNKYGLPVLGYTDSGDASFDKDTLMSYVAHPLVKQDPKLTDIVLKIRQYRKQHTLHNFFIAPYQEHQVDGIMHPDYNQIIRTGRMSCKRPNSQQLSPAAKELVHPYDGCAFVRWDYSQIEFRLIVHYIQDEKAIAAYLSNPDTDFHTWVAEMCGIPRKPAKNVNFCMGYGGGKKRVVSMLAANMDLVGDLSNRVSALIAEGKVNESQRQQVFELLCQKRGEEVYQLYHDTLPGLKSTTWRAAKNLEARGYAFNAYGRQRHLPANVSFRAFNTIIQSCAADIMKERTVAIAPRYNAWSREIGLILNASVHDETLANLPLDIAHDEKTLKKISDVFEDTAVKFRIPIRVSCGRGEKSWAEASSDEGAVSLK